MAIPACDQGEYQLIRTVTERAAREALQPIIAGIDQAIEDAEAERQEIIRRHG
jgi:hypothetical protein